MSFMCQLEGLPTCELGNYEYVLFRCCVVEAKYPLLHHIERVKVISTWASKLFLKIPLEIELRGIHVRLPSCQLVFTIIPDHGVPQCLYIYSQYSQLHNFPNPVLPKITCPRIQGGKNKTKKPSASTERKVVITFYMTLDLFHV